MKIHEYQGKDILRAYNVPVPRGIVASSPQEARQAAEALGIGRSLAYQFVLDGSLKSLKLGRCRRIPVTALNAFIEQQLHGDRA